MQKLQCELCGSIEFSRTDDGFFKCDSCGCKYTKEQAKTLIGVVETTIGSAEYNRLLEKAKTQIKLGQEYEDTIEKIIGEFPGEIEPYKIFLEIVIKDYLNGKIELGGLGVSWYWDKAMDYINSLYLMAKDSSRITSEELDSFLMPLYLKVKKQIVNDLCFEDILKFKLYKMPFRIFCETYKEILSDNCYSCVEKVFSSENPFAGDYGCTDFAWIRGVDYRCKYKFKVK